MNFNIENKASQMRKGTLEFCILLSLLERGQMYAADIIAQLQTMNIEIVEGTLYPLLSRLKKEGLLDYTWEESGQGPPRKYYRVNPEGEGLIKQLIKQWKDLNQSIQSLISNYEKNH